MLCALPRLGLLRAQQHRRARRRAPARGPRRPARERCARRARSRCARRGRARRERSMPSPSAASSRGGAAVSTAVGVHHVEVSAAYEPSGLSHAMPAARSCTRGRRRPRGPADPRYAVGQRNAAPRASTSGSRAVMFAMPDAPSSLARREHPRQVRQHVARPAALGDPQRRVSRAPRPRATSPAIAAAGRRVERERPHARPGPAVPRSSSCSRRHRPQPRTAEGGGAASRPLPVA